MNRRTLLRSAGLGAMSAPVLGALVPSAEAVEPRVQILQAQSTITTGNYTFAGESDLIPGVGQTVQTPELHHIIINGSGRFSRSGGISGGGTITHYVEPSTIFAFATFKATKLISFSPNPPIFFGLHAAGILVFDCDIFVGFVGGQRTNTKLKGRIMAVSNEPDSGLINTGKPTGITLLELSGPGFAFQPGSDSPVAVAFTATNEFR